MTASRYHVAGPLPILAAVLLLPAGCQHLQTPRGSLALTATDPSRPRKLNGSQVADVQTALGASRERQGDLAHAAQAYENALRHDPGRVEACRGLARVRDQQGRFAESRELYGKALAASPGNADVYCDMGYSLYLQHDWVEAEKNLRQAVAIQPHHGRAHTNLGLVLAFAGRDDDALAEFHCGGCTDAEARLNVAFAMTLEQRWDDARRQYEQALAADPGCVGARKGMSELTAAAAKLSARAASAPAIQLVHARELAAPFPVSLARPGPAPTQRIEPIVSTSPALAMPPVLIATPAPILPSLVQTPILDAPEPAQPIMAKRSVPTLPETVPTAPFGVVACVAAEAPRLAAASDPLPDHLAEAERRLRCVLARAPNYARAHQDLGVVLTYSGRSQEALAEFRSSGCSAGDAHLHVAVALSQRGRWAEVRLACLNALIAEPNLEAARKLLLQAEDILAQTADVRLPNPTDIRWVKALPERGPAASSPAGIAN